MAGQIRLIDSIGVPEYLKNDGMWTIKDQMDKIRLSQQDAGTKMATNVRYSGSSEMQHDGQLSIYDNLVNDACNLRNVLSANNNYTAKLQQQDRILNSVRETCDELIRVVVRDNALTPLNGYMSLVTCVDQIVTELNTKSNGQYLFGGMDSINTPAINDKDTILNGGAYTDIVSGQNNLAIGMNCFVNANEFDANNQAIANLFGALQSLGESLKSGNSSVNRADLIDNLVTAVKDIGSMRASIGTRETSVKQAKANAENINLATLDGLEKLSSPDLISLANLQASNELSFQTMVNMMSKLIKMDTMIVDIF